MFTTTKGQSRIGQPEQTGFYFHSGVYKSNPHVKVWELVKDFIALDVRILLNKMKLSFYFYHMYDILTLKGCRSYACSFYFNNRLHGEPADSPATSEFNSLCS